ncbi:hypothetical protein A3L12_03120 [Thermococcus sp. P6]|uniref:hypothetical protein n=1 Tax=Thermococcus sp. P6 TaxID=122420 RepID=UPI000B599905|nr:hypothetical protein [Thermococcus sp. P6]ASJ10359.1 hypothetical protein A3L12_03120 [Thermococcus sp. P6]
MELTIRRKAFLEDLPGLVERAVRDYGIGLRKIVIEEDEKGCYTVFITYGVSKSRPYSSP